MRSRLVTPSWSLVLLLVVVTTGGVGAQQPPTPAERVTFEEAIRRATERSPSVAVAAAGILRAEGLLRQARAATSLQMNANVTNTTLNRSVQFEDSTVTPRSQVTGTLTIDYPLLAAAAAAQRGQAADNQRIAELSLADVKRQVALSTADAYLSILTLRRFAESNTRARDAAQAHFGLAQQLEQGGTGSHLNTLRAQQEASTVEGALEGARLALYRAQEALGVLLVANGPVDAIDEPVFDMPAEAATGTEPRLLEFRTDLKVFAAEQSAAERVLRDSSKDRWPSLNAIFQPQSTYPAQFFVPANSWRFLLESNIPIFDSGQRASFKIQRQATLDQARATFAGAVTQAGAEVRAAREAVASTERSVASARAAADQAQQVMTITNITFRAGAGTNIEVIDAERSARDADTAAAVAEDTLRRARLDLLRATGLFPYPRP